MIDLLLGGVMGNVQGQLSCLFQGVVYIYLGNQRSLKEFSSLKLAMK